MSHAELPETPQPTEHSETAQEASARKESEEAALKKLREQAQKYKPKTSSRLSTVEEKSRSRSSSPPASAAADDVVNGHIGSDGMSDKQRRAARDTAADAWVAENVKWPEPLTYIDAGLCSEYIDGLMKTEVCDEGKQRAEEFYGKQFEDVLKWAYDEQAKGSQCALTWDNGRKEVVW